MEQFDQIISRYKIPFVLSVLGIVLVIGGVVTSGFFAKPKSSPNYPKQNLVNSPTASVASEFKVDISGAVLSPAVYDLPSDARVEDVVKIAGGFSPDANAEFISKSLNLSQKISDGMKIYIPFTGESITSAVSGGQVAGASSGIVNINTGSESELDSLPGVGSVTAQKIITGRPYSSIDDLKDKKIVSSSTFTKIKDQITVN